MADLEQLISQRDTAAAMHSAYATAHLLIGTDTEQDSSRRGTRDEDTIRRFITVVDEVGLDTIAELWKPAPAVSLPGALWRLYALRTWINNNPHEATTWYSAGVTANTSAEAVAGVASPPGPAEVAQAADSILHGVFVGDVSIALARAAAFVSITARGRRLWHSHDLWCRADENIHHFERMAEDLLAVSQLVNRR